MKKIFVFGNFGGRKDAFDGQTIKTRTIFESLNGLKRYNLKHADTSKKNPLTYIIALYHIITAKKSIILIGKNGIKKTLMAMNLLGAIRRTIYIVVGGWLADMAKNDKDLTALLKKLQYLLVETEMLKKSLAEIGVDNVVVFPNYRHDCGDDTAVSPKDGQLNKAVFFSRVCREKGVDMAINAIRLLNEMGKKVELDIYGPIQDDFKDEFDGLVNCSDSIYYCGCLKGDEIIKTLTRYDCMLFPTHYEGECFPGAVLEAMMAGLPVIASDWRFNREVVIDNETGLLFDTFSQDDLNEKLLLLYNDQELLAGFSRNSILGAMKYKEESVLPMLIQVLES